MKQVFTRLFSETVQESREVQQRVQTDKHLFGNCHPSGKTAHQKKEKGWWGGGLI